MSPEREDMGDEAREIEELEISLLLEAIYRRYGYDFRDYARAHLRRRLRHRLESSGLADLGAMQHRVLSQRDFFEQLLRDLSINVTEMFRDPASYRRVREDIVPLLKTYPFIKIWHAGCATGQEVYSMAILLHEEGLLERCRIYATDFNRVALQKAREGVYSLDQAQLYNRNYQKSGGRASLVDYYRTDSESMLVRSWLRRQVVFADHNLVTDGVFSEVQLVVCRNVVIYFNRELQERIFRTFLQSLCPGGFLWLGGKESLKLLPVGEKFSELYGDEKIFKKRLQ